MSKNKKTVKQIVEYEIEYETDGGLERAMSILSKEPILRLSGGGVDGMYGIERKKITLEKGVKDDSI